MKHILLAVALSLSLTGLTAQSAGFADSSKKSETCDKKHSKADCKDADKSACDTHSGIQELEKQK